MILSKTTSKKYYDGNIYSPEYKVGDEVYLESNEVKIGKSKKLSPNFKGPFKIIEVHDYQNATIKVKNKFVRVHVNRLKPLSSLSGLSSF